jgi:hypothetical protein
MPRERKLMDLGNTGGFAEPVGVDQKNLASEFGQQYDRVVCRIGVVSPVPQNWPRCDVGDRCCQICKRSATL